jgi:SAM-dependent methyltransferase
MNRELTNRIRFVLEDLVPPGLRDSFLFRGLVRAVWGKHVDRFAAFREQAAFLSDEEYAELYRDYPHIHDQTDNSEACIKRIIDQVVGPSICDVGCGSGMLLRRIHAARPDIGQLSGIDVELRDAERDGAIRYFTGKVEALPFADRAFDTVICTHVLEHVLDFRQALAELRRITKRRLIIVVPREREYRYTFNPHFHFFPYLHSFLRSIHPVPADYVCEDISRDIFYREDRPMEAANGC